MVKELKLKIGCHVSASGGVFNAPKNAADLGCETFQIFTRPPMGGKAPELNDLTIERFKDEMQKYGFTDFVVHTPYFINFGSKQPRIYHGSISVVGEELSRANMLGTKYVMTHLGSGKDLGQAAAVKQAKEGLTEVLKKYEDGSDALVPTQGSGQVGGAKTLFLLEIAAGAGGTLGGTFEQLAELMQPLVKFKTFGGICFDTQHAFASGYDLRDSKTVASTFKRFDKVIGLKWLKMSHINDSKIEMGGKKDRHEHIGEGMVGEAGFKALLGYLDKVSRIKDKEYSFPLILETEHDKVKADIEILKSIRDKSASHSSPSDARPSESRTGGKLRNKP
jgi:deoxyribonuclease-4